jgi:alkaline phosphatase
MHEMDGLAEVLRYLTTYLQNRDDTLIIATADHNTGGLSLGRQGKRRWQPEVVKQTRHSASFAVKHLLAQPDTAKFWQQYIGTAITGEQRARLNQARQQVVDTIAHAKHPTAAAQAKEEGEEQLLTLLAALTAEISHSGWTSSGHTGIDVQVFAYGQGKGQFDGHQDNTDIAKKIFKLMQ